MSDARLEFSVQDARFLRPLQFVLPAGRSLALHAPQNDARSASLLRALAGRLPLPRARLIWHEAGASVSQPAQLRVRCAYAAQRLPLPPLSLCVMHEMQRRVRQKPQALTPWLERLQLQGYEHTPWPDLPAPLRDAGCAALALASGAQLTLLDQPQDLAPALRAIWPKLLENFATSGRSLVYRTRSRELAQLADEVIDFASVPAATLGPASAQLQVRCGLAALQQALSAHPQVRYLHALPEPMPRDGGALQLWLLPSEQQGSGAKRVSELLAELLPACGAQIDSLSTRLCP